MHSWGVGDGLEEGKRGLFDTKPLFLKFEDLFRPEPETCYFFIL
jgi:hypothetical protein